MRLVNVHREPLVRPADPADFDAVLGVFDACWQMSYRGVLPDAVIATMTTTMYSPMASWIQAAPKLNQPPATISSPVTRIST